MARCGPSDDDTRQHRRRSNHTDQIPAQAHYQQAVLPQHDRREVHRHERGSRVENASHHVQPGLRSKLHHEPCARHCTQAHGSFPLSLATGCRLRRDDQDARKGRQRNHRRDRGDRPRQESRFSDQIFLPQRELPPGDFLGRLVDGRHRFSQKLASSVVVLPNAGPGDRKGHYRAVRDPSLRRQRQQDGRRSRPTRLPRRQVRHGT